jgi:hypothetical protein
MKRIFSNSERAPYFDFLLWETFYSVTPNAVVEWLIILLRIKGVPGSNLGPETGYPEGNFS